MLNVALVLKATLLVRPFDPTRDTLYVPLDKWDEFL